MRWQDLELLNFKYLQKMNNEQNVEGLNVSPAIRKTDVISRFYLWWIRTFKVISNKKAKELGLRHWRNVYGDEINHINCRSIWFDDKSRQYRVSHLEDVC